MLDQDYVGIQHILLGVLREGEGVAGCRRGLAIALVVPR
jgi:Clp amino terminal domain, pathogenicity island component